MVWSVCLKSGNREEVQKSFDVKSNLKQLDVYNNTIIISGNYAKKLICDY